MLVVGLGAAGAATLLALARRGITCEGIDRFSPPHDRGSSHGLSRLIRLCYYEHPDYVPLLRESYALWAMLQSQWARPILRITGGLYVGTPSDPFIEGSRQSAVKHTLAHEVLSRSMVADRYPQFRLRDDEVGFHEPTTGVLFPEEAIAAQLAVASTLGATVHRNERLLDWTSASDGINIATDRRRFKVDALIVAAGAWASRLVPQLAGTLRVTRQVLAWFRPADPGTLEAGTMPAWAVSEPDGSAHYGFPMFETLPADRSPLGGAGFKLALHKQGDAADPEHLDRTVRPDEVQELVHFLRDRIPSAVDPAGTLLDAKVCMYTNTPDQHFLVDKHPQDPRVVVVSACSGHGFKLSPAIGAAAADLATRGATELPVGFLRWR